MGFHLEAETQLINFDEDHRLHGLEIHINPPDIDELAALAIRADKATAQADDALGALDATRDLVEMFTRHVASWNAEDRNGQPIAPDPAGFKILGFSQTIEIIVDWMAAITGIPAPLDQPSTAGLRSVEASIPMEPSSLSQLS